jgi:hypothetical protein
MSVVPRPPSGHGFCVDRARGPVSYAKYRLPDGRQVQKKIGPRMVGARPSARGYFTKRLAEDWLRDVLDEARRDTLAGTIRTGATFADTLLPDRAGSSSVAESAPWATKEKSWPSVDRSEDQC